MLKVVPTLHLQAQLLYSVELYGASCSITRFYTEMRRAKEKPRPRSTQTYTWTMGRSSYPGGRQTVPPSRMVKKEERERERNMAIQSCQMYGPSWNIIFCMHLTAPLFLKKNHGQDWKRKRTVLIQRSWQNRSNQGSSSSPLHCFCTSSFIQTQTIFFAFVLYPWLILRVRHDWMDIILWTPANWSRTINRSSKMILLPPTVGFALRCWVQRRVIAGQMSPAANWNNNKDKPDGNK